MSHYRPAPAMPTACGVVYGLMTEDRREAHCPDCRAVLREQMPVSMAYGPCGICAELVPLDTGCAHWRPNLSTRRTARLRTLMQGGGQL